MKTMYNTMCFFDFFLLKRFTVSLKVIVFVLIAMGSFSTRAQEDATTRHVQIGDARFWLVQMPAEKDYRLAILGPKELYVGYGYLQSEAAFLFDSNFPDFIERWQLELYDGEDNTLRSPIYTIEGNWLPIGEKVSWNGELFDGANISDLKSIKYRLRVFDSKGHYAITKFNHIKLRFTPEVVNTISQSKAIDEATWVERMQKRNDIDKIHFGLRGGVIRIHAENLPLNGHFAIGSYVYPVGVNSDKAQITRYVPAARELQIPIILWDSNSEGIGETILEAYIEKNYFFMVALADITIGKDTVTKGSSNISDDALISISDDYYNSGSSYYDGRFAYYLKAKVGAKYLLTAQLDTGEDRLENVFKDIGRQDSSKLFKRIDPDRYYPVYGDQSTISRDVDTQGKFFMRLEWDNSELKWGNFNTGLGGTELVNYNRGLYGFNSDIRSNSTTEYGDQRYQVNAFISTSETKAAHDEFIGTGGSLYLLNFQDVVLGSAKIAVEVREGDSNRIRDRIELVEGLDYSIDEFQGRITLRRPLSPEGGRQLLSIIRETPLEGDVVYLVTDYEYVPSLSSDLSDNVNSGVRVKGWLNDHVGIGATYISESGRANEFDKLGTDVTFKFGKSSHVNLEYANSSAGQDIDFARSDNGGLSFSSSNFNANNVDVDLVNRGSNYVDGTYENVVLREIKENVAEGESDIVIDGAYALATLVIEDGSVKNTIDDIKFIRFTPGVTLQAYDPRLPQIVTQNRIAVRTVEQVTSGTALVANGKIVLADVFGEGVNGHGNFWYRKLDSNFDSVIYSNDNKQQLNYGVEGEVKLTKKLSTSGRISQDVRDDGDQENTKAGVNLLYKVNDRISLSSEYVFNGDDNLGVASEKETAGARAVIKIRDDISVNATAQQVLNSSDAEEKGDFQSGLGLSYKITRNIQINGEYYDGDNGSGFRLGGGYSGKNVQLTTGYDGETNPDIGAGANYEFNINPDNTFYANYNTESLDTEDDQWTLGHKSKITDKLEIYQEHRFKNSATSADQGQSYGLNYNATKEWTLKLDAYFGEKVEKNILVSEIESTSISSKYHSGGVEVVNKIELRTQLNELNEQIEQFHTASHFRVNLNEALTMRGKIDYSNTTNPLEDETGINYTLARFGEVDIGMAYRPIKDDFLNMLMVLTYQYDNDPQQEFSQLTIEGSYLDEVSTILSFDAIFDITGNFQLGTKLAWKGSEVRTERNIGAFNSVNTTLEIVKARYKIFKKWRMMMEFRRLRVDAAQDSLSGYLAAFEYHINNNFLVGLGYNFTQFNDDLTNLNYNAEGYFISLVGKY